MFITSVNKSILLVLLFITGCAVVDRNDNKVKTSALQANSSHISLGESVKLTFPKNHPRYMAVRTPSGD